MKSAPLKSRSNETSIPPEQFLQAKTIGTLSGRTISVEGKSTRIQTKDILKAASSSFTAKVHFAKKNLTTLKSSLLKDTSTSTTLKAFARSFFEDVVQNIHRPDSNETEIEEALSLLVETNSDLKSVYQGMFIRFLYDRKNFAEIANLYKNQIPLTSIPKDEKNIQQWVESCQKHIKNPIYKIDSSEYEDRMMELVERSLNRSTQLSPDEQCELEQFLLHAYANSALNKRLSLKKAEQSPSEEFMYEYTYLTLGPKKAYARGELGMSRLNTYLQDIKATFNTTTPIKIEGKEKKVSIQSLITSLRGTQDQPGIGQIIDDIYTFLSNPTNVPKALVKKAQQFCTAYKNTTQPIWDITAATHLLKHVQAIETIKGIQPLAQDFQRKIREATKIIEAFEQDSSLHQLPFHALNTMGKVNVFTDSLKPIARKCSSFNNAPVLKDLINACQETENVMNDLQFLSECMNTYQGGDVLLDDEILKKNYTESSGIPFSQFSFFKNIFNIPEFFKKVFDLKIWEIQPYFTGDKLHSGLIFPATSTHSGNTIKVHVKQRQELRSEPLESIDTNGALQEWVTSLPHTDEFKEGLISQLEQMSISEIETKDITTLIENNELTESEFEKLHALLEEIEESAFGEAQSDTGYQSHSPRYIDISAMRGVRIEEPTTSLARTLYRIQYRPQFDKLLTQKGSTRIGSTDAAQVVKELYTTNLKNRIEKRSEWKILEQMQLDPARGALSYLISITPTYTLKQAVTSIFNWFFGINGIFRPMLQKLYLGAHTPEDAEKITHSIHQRFCSELNVIMMKEVLLETETQLQERFGKEHAPYLKNIFPENVEEVWIYPNYLEDILKKSGCFEKIERPKLFEKLFTSNNK